MKTQTVDNPRFIKVIDPKLAEKLIASGFSYMREGAFFAFAETPDLISVLQREYSEGQQYFVENKLRF